MYRYWLIFAQTVTVCLAAAFTISTIRPGWISQQLEVDTPPTATVQIASNTTETGDSKETAIQPTATVFTSYSGAVKQAAPSVVNVYTTKHLETSPLQSLSYIPSLRGIIREQSEIQRRMNSPTSLGSGVIANTDGYILTNYHVVQAADSIEVLLNDGRRAKAKLVGSDPDTDLSVLKIDLPNLTPIRFDEQQKLNIGDVVLAIGNPFGVGQTTTMGIISALDRSLGINTYENFIQTDAAINLGNSGGALINVNGNLIGINTAIFSGDESSAATGIGFATPAPTALNVMSEIIANGEVQRGWLGVEPKDTSHENADSANHNEQQGIVVAGFGHGSPAESAGIRVNDVILEFNNKPVVSTQSMLNEVSSLKPGTEVLIKVLRDGRNINFKVTLAQRPKATG